VQRLAQFIDQAKKSQFAAIPVIPIVVAASLVAPAFAVSAAIPIFTNYHCCCSHVRGSSMSIVFVKKCNHPENTRFSDCSAKGHKPNFFS